MSIPPPLSNVVRDVQSVETYDASAKQKAAAKLSRIPIKVQGGEILKKPDWIRVKAGSPTTRFYEIKDVLRQNKLVTVYQAASFPDIGECFGHGTATFMIMGDKCTRRCPFCDVGHGRPDPLDANEPANLAKTIGAADCTAGHRAEGDPDAVSPMQQQRAAVRANLFLAQVARL